MDRAAAWIHPTEDGVSAGVDLVRSMPLFYARVKGRLIIGDDPLSIAEAAALRRPATGVLGEFLLSGFVTSGETLYEGVRQIPAGTRLRFRSDADGWVEEVTRQQTFLRRPTEGAEFQKLLDEYGRMLGELFADGLKRIGNRQIVVPLSGGLDSRLIAVGLRAAGAKSVVCYTYGAARLDEVVTSQAVAADLGFPWHWVRYSSADWREESGSEEWRAFLRAGGALSGVPHPQEWLAIRRLLRMGVIDRESCVVPGYSADLLAGSWYSRVDETARDKPCDSSEAVEEILRRHYWLWPEETLGAGVRAEARLRVEKSLRRFPRQLPLGDLLDAWNCAERQAKYIVNSARVFEQCGLSWWLPFFEREFVSFWETVPRCFLQNELLHAGFVERAYREATGREAPNWEGTHKPAGARLGHARRAGSWLGRRLPVTVRRRLLWWAGGARRLERDQMGWYGAVGSRELRRGFVLGGSMISALLGPQCLDAVLGDAWRDAMAGNIRNA